jgi:hypothetical protein
MVNNNLNINLNSTVPLNSINHKCNQHREIQRKMLQQDGVVMVEMQMLLMEMMMIPTKSGALAMTMATISPLREGISPADSCLLESFSLWCFLPHKGGGVYL